MSVFVAFTGTQRDIPHLLWLHTVVLFSASKSTVIKKKISKISNVYLDNNKDNYKEIKMHVYM